MVKGRGGIGLPEMIIAMAIITFCLRAIFGLLGNANSSFFNADTNIDLRNSLRLASDKMASELRNTGYKAGIPQFAIVAGGGTGGSDIIRFSVPVLCNSSMTTILDASTNPAYWGAPLTWGCNSSACMDANNDCSTLEYKYVEYSLGANNRLQRKILDAGLNTVANGTTILANYITNFQVSLTGTEFTLTLTGQKTSSVNKTFTLTYTSKVMINNQGG